MTSSSPPADISIETFPPNVPDTQGLFKIRALPLQATDTLREIQFIVSIDGQPPEDFAAFAFIGTFPQGAGATEALFFGSANAVAANRAGSAVIAQVVGGVNGGPPFSVTFTVPGGYWS